MAPQKKEENVTQTSHRMPNAERSTKVRIAIHPMNTPSPPIISFIVVPLSILLFIFL
jgi:hypothetical protein